MKFLRLFKIKRVILLISSITVLMACNNNTQQANVHPVKERGEEKSQDRSRGDNQAGNFIKFVQHKVKDRQATGIRAISYLIPDDWTVNDSLFWVYTDPNVPIRYAASCESDDHTQKIEIYPDYREVWSRGMMKTQGQKPPVDIIAGLKWIINYRRSGLQIHYTEEKKIPGTAMPATRQNGISGKSTSERGFVRFEYSRNGKLIEEVLYGMLETNQISTISENNPDAVGWSLSELLGCTAQKGKLENCKKIALTIRASSRMTLPFYNRLVQVIRLLQDQYYQQVYAAGQISKIISQTNDQILKTISDSYWNTQHTYDRVNQQFSDYIRGVDRYDDGSGYELQLPSGYGNAWVNGNNEYYVSDDPGFDPATAAGGNWKQLRRK